MTVVLAACVLLGCGRADTTGGSERHGAVDSPPTSACGAGAAVDAGSLGDGADRFVDGGDGTIADLVTGLVWEKKCWDCGGLHDAGALFHWSGDGAAGTVWDWLAEINAEAGVGLGGRSDWRLPNVKELLSLVDYSHSSPSVAAAFHTPDCARSCDDPIDEACSCTASGPHWTSTTFADFPAHAVIVGFGVGLVDDRLKTLALPVRAVRGRATGYVP